MRVLGLVIFDNEQGTCFARVQRHTIMISNGEIIEKLSRQ